MPKKIFSVMFHHLHDEIHKASQGSLSITDFKAMIEWLNINYSLIGAREYKQKFENNTLKIFKRRQTKHLIPFYNGNTV